MQKVSKKQKDFYYKLDTLKRINKYELNKIDKYIKEKLKKTMSKFADNLDSKTY